MHDDTKLPAGPRSELDPAPTAHTRAVKPVSRLLAPLFNPAAALTFLLAISPIISCLGYPFLNPDLTSYRHFETDWKARIAVVHIKADRYQHLVESHTSDRTALLKFIREDVQPSILQVQQVVSAYVPPSDRVRTSVAKLREATDVLTRHWDALEAALRADDAKSYASEIDSYNEYVRTLGPDTSDGNSVAP